MERLLRVGVVLSGAWALCAVLAQMLRARSFGQLEYFTRPSGSAIAGVGYALGPGLAPWAKESARQHPATYLAGVGYHLGILAGLAQLALVVAGVALDGLALGVLEAACLVGVTGGTGLLAKRLVTASLRGLSCPDDYAANLLATGFVALAGASAARPAVVPAFLAVAALLLLYAPLGKIKHSLFFFTTRGRLGAHYGRRGVFPPPA